MTVAGLDRPKIIFTEPSKRSFSDCTTPEINVCPPREHFEGRTDVLCAGGPRPPVARIPITQRQKLATHQAM